MVAHSLGSQRLRPITGSSAVTLSIKLRNVDLTLECEPCGHLLVKKGRWFWTVSSVKCQVCKAEQRLTYSDKVALFAKHAHFSRLEDNG
jgi:hypothetical protein